MLVAEKLLTMALTGSFVSHVVQPVWYFSLDRIITMGHQSRISMGLLSRQKIENEFDEKIIIAKYLEAIKSVLLK